MKHTIKASLNSAYSVHSEPYAELNHKHSMCTVSSQRQYVQQMWSTTCWGCHL
uniref:Uncharacterized protein n=1 Tax=Anguilla anguilla TaxID=7936 RepID=A0A0E9QK07_ANGAN